MLRFEVTNKVFYTLVVLVAIVIIAQFGFAGSGVDKTRSWHDAGQIRRNSTTIPDNNNSIDDDRDGKVDYVNEADFAYYAWEGGTDCLNKRGPVSANDKVVWCDKDNPKMMSCMPIYSSAPDAIVINNTPDCGLDGDCDGTGLGGARGETDHTFIYTERVLKANGTIEGCYAYSTADTNAYRLDISCCAARFVGDASPSACGNGSIDVGEQCEPGNLGGETCQTLGYDYGTLGCTNSCTFDTSACRYNRDRPERPVCFSGDTLVLTPVGPVPIRDLYEGAMVIAYDERLGKRVFATVLERRVYVRDEYYVVNGELRVTPMHRFAVPDGEGIAWVPIRRIRPGTQVFTTDGLFTIASKELVRGSPLTVYNPALSAPHTYYVIVDGQAVLVHNMKPIPQ